MGNATSPACAPRSSAFAPLWVFAALAFGCSSDDAATATATDGGVGGSFAGGAPGTGGGSSAGGGSNGGTPGAGGGVSGAGGNAQSGGSSNGGTSNGGTAGAGGSPSSGGTSGDSGTSAPTGCTPLPATGRAVDIGPSDDLTQAVRNAASGDTLLLADGTYALANTILQMRTNNVALRGKSGNREAVILDGMQSAATGEVIAVTGSDVTIADLTIVNAYTHAIHVQTTDTADTLRTTIYNVHIKDALEQAIKINLNAGETHFPDDGVVACSHIELTSAGRPNVRNNCYTGGVDAHGSRGWVIRDNSIEGFYCASGLSEHGVHFWTGSRGTVVERNRIFNCARGVGFGLGETTASSSDTWRTYTDEPCSGKRPVGHYGGVVRNNFIFANDPALFSSASGFDSGITFEQACTGTAVHNTIYGTTPPSSSAIEWRFANTSVTIQNNLANAVFKDRGGGAVATASANLGTATASMFVDAAQGDLHLSSQATAVRGVGVPVGSDICEDDIDGEPRSSQRDLGADQAR
jgi:hypothetical protein